MNKVRVVGWRVQPIVMLDDGTNLTLLNVNATEVPAAQWQAFKDGGDTAAITDIEAQVAAMEPPPNRAARRANGKAKSAI